MFDPGSLVRNGLHPNILCKSESGTKSGSFMNELNIRRWSSVFVSLPYAKRLADAEP